MTTLDSILDFVIPFVLILLFIGFIYTKFLDPWLMPHLKRLIAYLRGEGKEEIKVKEIIYE